MEASPPIRVRSKSWCANSKWPSSSSPAYTGVLPMSASSTELRCNLQTGDSSPTREIQKPSVVGRLYSNQGGLQNTEKVERSMILTSTGVSDSTLVGLEPTRRAHSSGLSFAPIVNLSNTSGGNCRCQHSTTRFKSQYVRLLTVGYKNPTFSHSRNNTGRMDEDDLGKVTGPRENATSDFIHLPV